MARDRYGRFLAAENGLVGELVAAGLSQRAALSMVGLSRSTWHYRRVPRGRVVDPVHQADRAYQCRLGPVETARIRSLIETGMARGDSVFVVWFEALDAGDPVASLSSWYRVARRARLRLPVNRRKRRATAMPQFEARSPNEVWCWDITKLPGRYQGQWYCFYVVIDVFSRLVVGWRIEEHEDDDLAGDMFESAFTAQGCTPRIVHSDGGPSMTSNVLKDLFTVMGITRSRNRPRVSNDNPHIESWFKTAKYSAGYPGWFTDLDHARCWAATLIERYNEERPHAALEGHTPRSVHDGTWVEVHHHRQAVLDALAASHPERFRRPPRLRAPYATVTLNTPRSDDRLQTG